MLLQSRLQSLSGLPIVGGRGEETAGCDTLQGWDECGHQARLVEVQHPSGL